MPFLPSSGPLSINDIRNLFGGPGSPSMANYYRGGAYIPATKTVNITVREPASGVYGPDGSFLYVWDNDGFTQVFWGGRIFDQRGAFTSVTIGSFTYFPAYLPVPAFDIGVFRTYPSSVQQAINTGIPGSGQISISQFYGAEKP